MVPSQLNSPGVYQSAGLTLQFPVPRHGLALAESQTSPIDSLMTWNPQQVRCTSIISKIGGWINHIIVIVTITIIIIIINENQIKRYIDDMR